MVRVKFRYLVVNFLYPAPSVSSQSKDSVPDLLQFHAPSPDSFHAGHIVRLVRDGVADLFGDYGSGMINASLKINYWSPATSTAIIRCSREHYEMVWAALTFVTKLPKPHDTPVVVKVVRVSGTIRKAEEEVIKRAKLIIRRAKRVESTGDDQVMESVVKAVEKRREKETTVLAEIDDDAGSESDSGSNGD